MKQHADQLDVGRFPTLPLQAGAASFLGSSFTPRAPSGALRERQRLAGLVHFDGSWIQQIERVDQQVTTQENDEAQVRKVLSPGLFCRDDRI